MASSPRFFTDAIAPARLALILAAERLAGEHGVQGFSFRQLNDAAGSRNSSAVHYHFGSREALIRAVAEYRMAPINRHRLALIDLSAEGDLAGIVQALIAPLAEQLVPRPGGNHFVRFQERLIRDADYITYEIDPGVYEGWRRADDMLRRALSTLPAELTELRLRLTRTLIISALANMEAELDRGGLQPETMPAMVASLNDGIVAMLRATPTAPQPILHPT